MISKDGFAKILDFGLAKLTEAPTHDQSVAPTAIAAPTQPGTVMGTAGYMSPEQAAGQAVDFHSDQFTLGAILYEMATGRRAFQRKTGAETLVAIIREEPEPLSQLAPKAPAPVRWIVERLLAKDPEERYASTKDLARDLKSVRDHLTETSFSGGLEAAEPAKAPRRRWLVPALLALVLGAGLGFLLRANLKTAPPPRIQFQRLTFQRGRIQSARFAPDGQTIVYSAAWDGGPLELYSTRPDSAEFRSLGLPGAVVLSISSGGRDRRLSRLPLPRRLRGDRDARPRAARGRRSPRGSRERPGRGLVPGRQDPRRVPERREPESAGVPDRQGPLRVRGVGRRRARVPGRALPDVRRPPAARKQRRPPQDRGCERRDARAGTVRPRRDRPRLDTEQRRGLVRRNRGVVDPRQGSSGLGLFEREYPGHRSRRARSGRRDDGAAGDRGLPGAGRGAAQPDRPQLVLPDRHLRLGRHGALLRAADRAVRHLHAQARRLPRSAAGRGRRLRALSRTVGGPSP